MLLATVSFYPRRGVIRSAMKRCAVVRKSSGSSWAMSCSLLSKMTSSAIQQLLLDWYHGDASFYVFSRKEYQRSSEHTSFYSNNKAPYFNNFHKYLICDTYIKGQ